jgi:quinol monooxygenase YgiN
MICIIAGMVARTSADADALCAAAVEVARHTLQESGCQHYTFARDIHDPLVIQIAELWESETALRHHLRTPHIQQFISAVAALNLASMRATMFDGANARDPRDLVQEA